MTLSTMESARLKQLIDARKEKGYVLCEEIRELLPEDYETGRELEDILSELANAGIEIFEEPTIDFELEAEKAEYISDDPVRVYLREMGRVPKLTSDGEIE